MKTWTRGSTDVTRQTRVDITLRQLSADDVTLSLATREQCQRRVCGPLATMQQCSSSAATFTHCSRHQLDCSLFT